MKKTLLLVLTYNFSSSSSSFPPDLTIYEFGSKEHSFGGLKWDDTFNHPTPYEEPVSESLASLFQYLTPDPMPTTQFHFEDHPSHKFYHPYDFSDHPYDHPSHRSHPFHPSYPFQIAFYPLVGRYSLP